MFRLVVIRSAAAPAVTGGGYELADMDDSGSDTAFCVVSGN